MSEQASHKERIASIEERLKEHRSLGVAKRIVRRAVGNYPEREEREALRQHKLGADGRIAESIVSALDWTHGLNSTPSAILRGRWVKAELFDGLEIGTVPTDVKKGTELHTNLLKLFRTNGRTSTAESMDAVGLYVDQYDKWLSKKDNAARLSKVGIMAMHDFNAVDAIVLSREDILALEPDLQSSLEETARLVDGNAFVLYRDNKPENVG